MFVCVGGCVCVVCSCASLGCQDVSSLARQDVSLLGLSVYVCMYSLVLVCLLSCAIYVSLGCQDVLSLGNNLSGYVAGGLCCASLSCHNVLHV